jgi:hypothetical protein
MTTVDFTRAFEGNIKTLDDRKLNAIYDYTRDDSGSVDYTGLTIKMEIYDRRGGTLLDTLTSGTEITIATARLTYTKILTALSLRSYYFQVFDDDNKQGIHRGNLIIE